jgi:hypothetical protein
VTRQEAVNRAIDDLAEERELYASLVAEHAKRYLEGAEADLPTLTRIAATTLRRKFDPVARMQEQLRRGRPA